MSDRSNGQHGSPGAQDHLDEDQMLDLVHDLLPGDLKRQAVAHMATCPACERTVRARVAENARSRSETATVLARLDASLAERRSASLSRSRTPQEGGAGTWRARLAESWRRGFHRPSLRLGVGLAAVVLATVLVVGRPFVRSTDKLPLYPLPDAAAMTVLRDAGDKPASDPFKTALEAYSRQEYRRAAELLEAAEVPARYQVFRDIYLGSSLAWCGRFREAERVLQGVDAAVLPAPWRNEVRWTLLVTWSRLGRQAQADSVLRALAREPGNISERALELLGER